MNNKCNYYHIEYKRANVYNPLTGQPFGGDIEVGVCWGTRERDQCSCGGDRTRCSFYVGVREEAKKTISVEDAIDHYRYGISHDIFSEPVTTYAKIAVDALEKQIPKKPIIWENMCYSYFMIDDDWGYECPCCKNREIDYPEHHCICGQALDWSEIV